MRVGGGVEKERKGVGVGDVSGVEGGRSKGKVKEGRS